MKKEQIDDFTKLNVDFEDFDLDIRTSDDDHYYMEYKLEKNGRKNPLTWKEDVYKRQIWKPENISASDLEKVICSGIPINKMGNLKKMSASILAKHFSQKRFSRQRINNILNHKFPVERFDLITLEFFVISQAVSYTHRCV